MDKRLFKNTKPKTIDKSLDSLESINQRKEEIKAEEAQTVKKIREGFQEVVVMFIDMVDSTKFKTAKQESPEKWIIRVRQFSDIVGEYINECGGRIVKYIGDELMAVFNRESKVNDAINLINRINDLQRDLSEITTEPTSVKIVLDFGKVYFLEYDGHNEPDPQGTPVDRCARIAKYCKAGVVLTSYDFVNKCDRHIIWTKIGEVELKGIGTTRIYQFGEQTFEVVPMKEVPESEFTELKEKLNRHMSEIEDLTLKYKEALSINKELAEQLKDTGEKVDQNLVLEEDNEEGECERNWNKIKNLISGLKKIIQDCPASTYEYARFLFLYQRDEPWEYNRSSGDEFKSSIENNLVEEVEEGYYKLDASKKRNNKAIETMDEIEFLLNQYDLKCRKSDDRDLFDFSLKSPEFWQKYIGFSVTR